MLEELISFMYEFWIEKNQPELDNDIINVLKSIDANTATELEDLIMTYIGNEKQLSYRAGFLDCRNSIGMLTNKNS